MEEGKTVRQQIALHLPTLFQFQPVRILRSRNIVTTTQMLVMTFQTPQFWDKYGTNYSRMDHVKLLKAVFQNCFFVHF